VPVGGWGPSLGPGHLDPVAAAEAVRRVGARVAIPVHFGTFWPIGCDWLKPELFLPPGDRFRAAMAEVDLAVKVELLVPGESTEVVAR
jgi:L-ascorbate metabolism protein UlaG (beta-lactamase superfamily)